MKAQQESKARWGGSRGEVSGKAAIPAELTLEVQISQARGGILPLREVRRRAEAAAVRQALAVAGGNVSKAAELLGVTRPTLYDLMERIAQRAQAK